MPVIKANAYGTYINKRIDILDKFNIVAVDLIYEAIELRKHGYKKEIFVLNQPDIHEIELIDKYDITDKRKRIATVPIGYGDGYRRSLTNKGHILVNGKKAKILGAVCMDSCMIDISDIENVKTGDQVIIFDNETITLDDIAKQCDTINYEILSTFNERIPRIFTKDW